MNLSDYLVSVIRTGVAVVLGAVASWAVRHGLNIDAASATAYVTPIAIAAYYALVRLVETKWPQAGFLLGVPKAPAYTTPPVPPGPVVTISADGGDDPVTIAALTAQKLGWRSAERAPLTVDAVKLGKAPKKFDKRTLQLRQYIGKVTPKPAVDWTTGIAAWPMMGNDTIGDCTCAAAGHDIELWTAHANPPGVVPSDGQVIAAYSAVTGYTPSNPNSDQGAVELDVLNYWRTHGIAGHKITAFAEVNPTLTAQVKFAIETFGGLYIGLDLPLSAQRQRVWDVTRGAGSVRGSWGGHAVPVVAYDASHLTCVTWGGLKRMTWAFFRKYCDEAYAVLSADWLDAHGHTPEGLDLAALQADLAKITR